jgi:hypothetical protein
MTLRVQIIILWFAVLKTDAAHSFKMLYTGDSTMSPTGYKN